MTSFTSSFTTFIEEFNLDLNAISQFLNRGTKVGKILKRMGLNDEDVQKGVLAFRAAEFVDQIILTSDPMDIEMAYSEIKSCMTEYAENCGIFYSHPTLIEQGIQVALFCNNGTLLGRCLVNTLTKIHSPHYTTLGYEEFAVGLAEMGFIDDLDNGRSALTDVNIPILSHLPGVNMPNSCPDFIPYLDGTGVLLRSKNAAFIVQAIEDEPDFSSDELESVLCEFISHGHSPDIEELEIWSGSCWKPYGKMANNSSYGHDWQLELTRSPMGYFSNWCLTPEDSSLENMYGIFDNFGELCPVQKSPGHRLDNLHSFSQYNILNAPEYLPWHSDEKPWKVESIWSIKDSGTLWYHSL